MPGTGLAAGIAAAAAGTAEAAAAAASAAGDRKSTRLNSSHSSISYAVFCLKKKKNIKHHFPRKHSKSYTASTILTLVRIFNRATSHETRSNTIRILPI